ncbi:transposase IS116/IS110/IS902 family domain protein [Rhodococcus sp. MTM3W5.2]|nr:transposase IS116/IS110/IS902 family domain protein [Rhodococcus sp. MTM3W5.2]
MIVVGIDMHKSTHTTTAVDTTANTDLGSIRINALFYDYAQLMTSSKPRPDRTRSVEYASGLGHRLTQWLISRRGAAVNVPSTRQPECGNPPTPADAIVTALTR